MNAFVCRVAGFGFVSGLFRPIAGVWVLAPFQPSRSLSHLTVAPFEPPRALTASATGLKLLPA